MRILLLYIASLALISQVACNALLFGNPGVLAPQPVDPISTPFIADENFATETSALLSLSRASATPKPKRFKATLPVPTALSSTHLVPPLLITQISEPTAIETKPSVQICSPIQDVDRGKLSKLISESYHPPPMGSDARHQGVDFANYRFISGLDTFQGAGVQSVLPGKVAAALANTYPFGNLVITETQFDELPANLIRFLKIPTGKSLYILYAHMEADPIVHSGEGVTSCQIVGAIGRSGNTDAIHLHLETRTGPPDMVFEGFSAFVDTATEEEKSNYRLWRVSGVFLHFDPMLLLSYGLPQ